MDLPDHTLLDRFAAQRDEAAFRTLVARHLDLVHAVARRVTANDELARDVSQSTFIRLAERAAMIPRHITLPAWLHRTARSLAVDLVRNESRRRQRELSTTLHTAMEDPPEPDWSALSPLVDELVQPTSCWTSIRAPPPTRLSPRCRRRLSPALRRKP